MMLAKGYKAALMAGVAMLALAGSARAQNNTIQGWCQVGGIKAVTQGMISSNTLQGSYPRCSVTVYLTGTSTKATLHTSASGGTLTNPFTANTDGSWLLWAASGAYDVVMAGGTPIAMPYAVTLTDVVLGSGGGGGGGCSVGGIPTTGGIVDGDVTSTNCGTGNRSGDTAGTPADVQTFGYTNGTGNSGTDVVLMGERNGVGNQASDLVAIGNGNAYHSGSAPLQGQHIIGIGTGTLGTSDFYGAMVASVADFIAIGNGAGSMFHSSTASDAIAIGDGAGADWIGSTNNIIGIGSAGASDHNGSNNVVGIGNGSATGSTPSGSPPTPTTNVADVVGVGNGAAGKNNGSNVIALGNAAAIYNAGNEVIAVGHAALKGYASGGNNTGTENIAIGDHANTANTSGAHNIVMGDFAGANGWVDPLTLGNANLTGSNNTWVGDFSGPSTATQLDNTIAIGANASVSASNSATYGNSSITQTDIYGTTTIHGAGTINGLDVPEGTAGSGAAGRDKLWADATSHCWMISNNGGSGACISTGGGGGGVTSINGTAGAFTFAGNVVCATTTCDFEPGYVAVENFGAVGNSNGTAGNGTDDRAAIQACLDEAVTTNQYCVLQAKIYRITGTLNLTQSAKGLVGVSGAQGFTTASAASRLMIDSASANALHLSTGSFQVLKNLMIFRSLLPTGSATGVLVDGLPFAGGLIADNLQIADNIYGMYLNGGGSFGNGGIRNVQSFNGYNPAVTGYGSTPTTCFYLHSDATYGFASLNFEHNTCADGSTDTANLGLALDGEQINDVYVRDFQTLSDGTGIKITGTGTNGVYDDHFLNLVIQSPNGIIVSEQSTVLSHAQLEFTGWYSSFPGSGPAFDIEHSQGVSVHDFQVYGGSSSIVSNSNRISFQNVQFTGSGLAVTGTRGSIFSNNVFQAHSSVTPPAIVLVGSSNNAVNGNTLDGNSPGAFTPAGITFDATSNNNATCGNNISGTGTVAPLFSDAGAGNQCSSTASAGFPVTGTGVALTNPTSGKILVTGPGGGVNGNINFGTDYGVFDITMYDGGAGFRYGWGLTGGTMNFVVPSLANAGGHFAFSNGGDLGATAPFAELFDTARWNLGSGGVFGFSATADASGASDTGLSRDSAGVVDVGNGTAGNASGTLKAATGTYSTALTVAGNNVCQSTGTNCPASGTAATIASSETVASSATPTFSVSFNVSYNVLTANVTSFTLAAGSDGQSKTLTFCQNGTGNFTVAAPANVHGFFTVGATASKCSSQHFNYSTAQTAWLADSPGVVNE